jgi:rod shape-determining protein MreC
MRRESRRARRVLVVLLLTAFTLMTLDLQQEGGPTQTLRSAGNVVFGPVERAGDALTRPVSTFVSGVAQLDDYQDRIDALQRRNDELNVQLRTSEEARSRAAELDDLLGVASVGQYRVVPARVIAVGSGSTFDWTATVDAGSRDGLATDMTVLSGDGLVGRVTDVGPVTSTVLLAADPESAIGARLEGSQQIGVVSGRGTTTMRLELLDPQAEVASGDRLVTFGSQGGAPFVPGVPVGEVVDVEETPGSLTRAAMVKPYASFTSLDLVGIVVEPPREDPRDAVLPPRPPAS